MPAIDIAHTLQLERQERGFWLIELDDAVGRTMKISNCGWLSSTNIVQCPVCVVNVIHQATTEMLVGQLD